MAKKEALATGENPFVADEPVAAVDAPAEPPYNYAPGLGYYIPGVKTIFDTEGEVLDYLNSADIKSNIDAFLAHVDANPEEYFTVAAKKQRTQRDGTVLPATEARPMDERAKLAARTRLESGARAYVQWYFRTAN